MEGLFKFGNADFSNLIRAESYEVTPCARQDLDSYRDALGVLHRTALEHTATIVEFNVKMLDEKQMANLMTAVKGSYINYYERDAMCQYFDPESGTMKTGHFYIDSNLKFSLYAVWKDRGGKIFNETHFKFVEY